MISQKFDPNKPYRYVKYGRMSSDTQNERSPDQQFDEIQRTLDRLKYPWILSQIFRDDGISGRFIAKRPSFKSMIDGIMTGRLDVNLIVVDTLERFGRMKNLDSIRRELVETYGVLVVTADTGFADPTGSAGEALGFIEHCRATQDGKTKAHNVLRGKRDVAKLKRWPGGPFPLGYRRKRIIELRKGEEEFVGSQLVPDPVTTPLVRMMFDLAHKKGWGSCRIAKELNGNGEIPVWFAPLVDEIEAHLNALRKSQQTDTRPMLERELQDIQARVDGWNQSLASSTLPMQVRRRIEERYGEALGRKAQIESELASLAGAEESVKQNLDPKRVIERLHKLTELMERSNPTELFLALAQHIERIEIFADRKVVMRTCRLGAFEGLEHVLSSSTGVATAVTAPSGNTQKIRPRILVKRRDFGATLGSSIATMCSRQAEDPDRFVGLGATTRFNIRIEPCSITRSISAPSAVRQKKN